MTKAQMREMTESDYSALLRGSPVPIVVHGEDSRVVDANPAFAELFGYSMSEVLNLHAHDVIHPDDQAVRDHQAEQLLNQEHTTMNVARRLVRKDGSSVWAKVRKSSIKRPDGVVVMVFFEDWTDQHWDDPAKFDPDH
ncbi:PAS domain S-box protein [Antrihabitans cavernicola]|uniref:PAS domain S-box protein n=1 Tax=Antrihabitans cavernicola TaxID=2495913 RepID=A0A5A7S5W3_9NOCA|nr:PAS domain S-box protein [Spelaeibacter cavernicola]KAA0018927.1 PAS domain S-box protein [Spelaeibacter cavernicola]